VCCGYRAASRPPRTCELTGGVNNKCARTPGAHLCLSVLLPLLLLCVCVCVSPTSGRWVAEVRAGHQALGTGTLESGGERETDRESDGRGQQRDLRGREGERESKSMS